MVGFGVEPFGNADDFKDERAIKHNMETWGVHGFDSIRNFAERGIEFADNDYHICIDAVYRIVGTLKGRLVNIERESLDNENEIYHIDFVLDGKPRRFTYCAYRIINEPPTNNPVRSYLTAQKPDALLLKAIPDGLYQYKDFINLALAQAPQTARYVLSDARIMKGSQMAFNSPHPVFKQSANLKKISLKKDIGYGRTLFLGDGSDLIYTLEHDNQRSSCFNYKLVPLLIINFILIRTFFSMLINDTTLPTVLALLSSLGVLFKEWNNPARAIHSNASDSFRFFEQRRKSEDDIFITQLEPKRNFA